MIDDYFTWWMCGRSYLCRMIDMLHMGYVDEVLFGSEVTKRLPGLAKEWIAAARVRPELITQSPQEAQVGKSRLKADRLVREWVESAIKHPEQFNTAAEQAEEQMKLEQLEIIDESAEDEGT
jgi:hypothetical protein